MGKKDEKLERNKERDVSVKENHRVIDRLKKSLNLTWLRVRMSYHRYYNLAELLNGYLAAKIGRGIFSKD